MANTTRTWGRWVTIPHDLEAITTRSDREVAPEAAGLVPDDIDAIWRDVQGLYRSRTQPAVVLCLRKDGQIIIDRALGHRRDRGPSVDPSSETWQNAPLVKPDTPFCIFSASKAVTAMLMHALDASNLIRLDDPVCEYIPEFAQRRKHWITLRHVLTHRAGLPSFADRYDPLAMVDDWDAVVRLLCEARPVSAAGRRVAYHAVTGGYIMGEAVRRATGKRIEDHLLERFTKPMGLDWLSYGCRPDQVASVAQNAFTGLPVPFPISTIVKRALGLPAAEAVAVSNDPRYLTTVIPSGNLVGTAHDVSAFFQMLLDEGQWRGKQVMKRRAIQRARVESAFFPLDLTLGFPVRYGQGLMLGARNISMFGRNTRLVFGHYGFIAIVAWADPERDVAGCLLTSGKPIVGNHMPLLWRLLTTIAERCDHGPARHTGSGRAAKTTVK